MCTFSVSRVAALSFVLASGFLTVAAPQTASAASVRNENKDRDAALRIVEPERASGEAAVRRRTSTVVVAQRGTLTRHCLQTHVDKRCGSGL